MSRSTTSGMSRVTAAEMLSRYNEKAGQTELAAAELKIQKLFAQRSAHLPGNNWCQDWFQWMRNNHPLLGLCFRHRLNPVGMGPRLVILLSSVSFGLIATNLIYLFYRTHPDANGSIINIEFGEDGSPILDSFQITYEAVCLWTLGGLLHSLMDLGMWHRKFRDVTVLCIWFFHVFQVSFISNAFILETS